jgi:hypothetical protein
MVVFMHVIVVSLMRGFVDGGVLLAVVVRGVLHVGTETSLVIVDDNGMTVFPHAWCLARSESTLLLEL